MSPLIDSSVSREIRESSVVRSARRVSWAAGQFVHSRLGDGTGRRTNGLGGRSSKNRGKRTVTTERADPSDIPRPFRPEPMESVANPVLTARDVHDHHGVDFVADPFLLVTEGGDWHLFFEIFDADAEPTAVIGHATSDDGGRSWRYDRVVLREDVHLAFPYVFEWEGEFYMVPEKWDRDDPAEVQLYRATNFPDDWQPVSTVVRPDRQLADCVVFRWNDRWWAVLGSMDGRYDLLVYHTDDLRTDGWTPHERNPVASGRPRAARPGGRPVVGEDRILLFLQDCVEQYGDKVRAFEITRLSRTEYAGREWPESPILEGTDRRLGWNSGRMHHIDPLYTDDGWVCAVDGNIGLGRRIFGGHHWSIGMYRA